MGRTISPGKNACVSGHLIYEKDGIIVEKCRRHQRGWYSWNPYGKNEIRLLLSHTITPTPKFPGAFKI